MGARGGKPAFSPEEPGQHPALTPSPYQESSLEKTLSEYFSETMTLSAPSERRFRAQRPDPREGMGTTRTGAGFLSSGRCAWNKTLPDTTHTHPQGKPAERPPRSDAGRGGGQLGGDRTPRTGMLGEGGQDPLDSDAGGGGTGPPGQ